MQRTGYRIKAQPERCGYCERRKYEGTRQLIGQVWHRAKCELA